MDELDKYKYQLGRRLLADAGMFTEVEGEKKKCKCCGFMSTTVARRPLNTMYVDDERNFLESCKGCYEETIDYYKDLWSEYYSMVM